MSTPRSTRSLCGRVAKLLQRPPSACVGLMPQASYCYDSVHLPDSVSLPLIVVGSACAVSHDCAIMICCSASDWCSIYNNVHTTLINSTCGWQKLTSSRRHRSKHQLRATESSHCHAIVLQSLDRQAAWSPPLLLTPPARDVPPDESWLAHRQKRRQ